MIVSEELVMADIQRVVEREGRGAGAVRPTDRLVDDLGLDSLSLTSLAVELEDRYQVILNDDDATRLNTVAELARCVVERVRDSAAEPDDAHDDADDDDDAESGLALRSEGDGAPL
jgi:acyl carrier protein